MMIAYQGNNFHGFTLIELIITIAIAGILLSLSIPLFSNMLAKNQRTTVLHTLFSHLNLARNEAIKTNQRVLICKSVDGRQCSRNTSWSDGWLIFTDTNRNKMVNNNENIIHIQAALSKNISIDYKGNFGINHYFQYKPSGRSSSNGTFTICSHSDEKMARSIIINLSGRARIDTKSSSGKTLTCS